MKKQLLILLISGFLVLGGCMPSGSKVSKTENEAVEKPSIKVQVAPVETSDIQSWISFFGDVKAKSTISIAPDTSGRIHRIYVNPGDQVKKGQSIADIDPSRPGLQYALSPVVSPITGTITRVSGEEGAMVSPQIAIAQVSLLDELEISLEVPERFIFQLDINRQGIVSTEALPGFSQSVVVSEISPVINPVSRTATVTLKLINDQKKLKPGMFLDVLLLAESKKNVLVTLESALIQRDEAAFVYIESEGFVSRREVTIGITSKGKVEILTGLSEGDLVVTSGKNLLYNGAPVTVTSKEML